MQNEEGTICNERIFNDFFKSNARLLRNYLYYKFGDLDQAEDLVQESFIKLWNNCSKVSTGKAKSYVYTVATNLGISITRHQKVKFKYQDYVKHVKSDVDNQSPEFLALEDEFKVKLDNALAKLSDRQREVFLLSRIDKKTYKEIAQLSDVSVKAVEKLMHKALLSLRESIGNI
ncbi:RNA polymerase sigma factor [Aquimarina intermedia]|uniref:RNA polymerase sigma-70 factor (ECF subfamily) n=1 Tax=Aquimarina intermedia TaxID=350814 RepID=A0A5S5C0P4_9FLAO|nr:RNA polymerase sigma factor [Aquimarina intermedia]TYP72864.1 RNA polymerase sigma-70 factor (ECF subfamily) [Aquimarina intermedia]